MDDFGFEQAIDGFSERIVITVADAADRWLDAGLKQALAIADREVLGGFKRSSQHAVCSPIGATGQAPLRVFSRQVSFGAGR